MAEKPKTDASAGAAHTLSVNLSVDAARLPSIVSAALSLSDAASALISVRGTATEIQNAVKALDVHDSGPVSALIRVRGK